MLLSLSVQASGYVLPCLIFMHIVSQVELAKKNAEADHLIHVVGVETEKCTQEKAQAEVEKVKVAEINVTVTAKQIDCERDLKKAEPALFAAQEALNTLNKVSVR